MSENEIAMTTPSKPSGVVSRFLDSADSTSRKEETPCPRKRKVERRAAAAKAAVAAAGSRVCLPDTERVLVAYSGGKDSLCVLDICCRAGKHVEAYFMYFPVPDMDYTRFWVSYAERRWGIKVRVYAHWMISQFLREGIFRNTVMDVPQTKPQDAEALARLDSGLEWIGYGYRSTDSLERRGMMASWPGGICEKRRVFAPLKDWKTADVFNYLQRNHIVIPPDMKASGRQNGLDLKPSSLLFMREHWPDDYKRILKVFPNAAAQADRGLALRGAGKIK